MIWDYIKTKISSVLGLTATQYNGNAKTATTATKANALSNTTAIGSATNPVYIDASGVPTKTTYTLSKSVPSNAVFTDTTYSNFVKAGSGAKAGLVPAPSTTAGTTKYLCEDGTWKDVTASNADTVDGVHAANLVYYHSTQITDTALLNDANHAQPYEGTINGTYASAIGLPGDWWHIKYMKHVDNNGYGLQIVFPLNDSIQLPKYRTSVGAAWDSWKNIADGGNANTANSTVRQQLEGGTDILAYATSDSCPKSRSTVTMFNSPTCPTNYGFSATDNHFIYDILKWDNLWVTIVAHNVRDNDTFINRCCNGTWKGWKRVNDGGTASTANYAGNLVTTATTSCLRNISAGTAEATTSNCPDGALYGQYS